MCACVYEYVGVCVHVYVYMYGHMGVCGMCSCVHVICMHVCMWYVFCE